MNSTIEELAETTVGALLYKRLMKEWESEQKDAGNKADDAEREMVTSMMREMPLRSAVMLSEGRLPLETAELILDVINGKKSKLALTQLLGGLPGAGVQEGR
jgi:hypothetical protein